MVTIGLIGGPRDSVITREDVYYQLQKIMIACLRDKLSLEKLHREMLSRFPENENVKDLEKALFELCSLDYDTQEDIVIACSESRNVPTLITDIDEFKFSTGERDRERARQLSEALRKSDNFLERKMYANDYQYATMWNSKRKGTKKRKRRK